MEDNTIRVNKYLANLGICARRDVKKLLKEQTLTINGQRVKEQGVRLDPQKDDVRLNGKKIEPPKMVYYLLNKPKGIVSTTADEFNRKNVTSLIPTKQRIYPVGRLDKDTTGLILLTNDGELTNLLTHPRYHVYKVYRLTIQGKVNTFHVKALRDGVLLEDGITAPAKVRVVRENGTTTILEMTLFEGRNRQIRRMCETVGIKLTELDRVSFGSIRKGNLSLGSFRELTGDEILALKTLAHVQ